MPNKRFETLCTNILHGLWEMDPVNATYLGIHNYDSLYPRTDALSRDRYEDQLAHFLKLLAEFTARKDELDFENQIDLDLLIAELRSIKRKVFKNEIWLRNPVQYTESFLFGLYLLNIRSYLSPDLRLTSIIDRLMEAERFFAEAIENLSNPDVIPQVHADIARQQLAAAEGYLAQLESSLTSEFPIRKYEIQPAFSTARASLVAFAEHLSQIGPQCSGEFAIGREEFDFLLKNDHMLTDSPESLSKLGHEMIVKTLAEMVSLGREIDPEANVADLLEQLKDNHPDINAVVSSYADEMEAARQFVHERDLVTIPEHQKLTVEQTPVFQRSMIPFAAYVPPPPFATDSTGLFWVTPPDAAAQPDILNQQLREHSRWGIPITALHEGYPGHHLQLCLAKANPSPVKRNHMNNVFIEGWALYCEEMMRSEGFPGSKESHLMQLNDQLWRACRVVIDVGLHCEGLSLEEAADILVKTAGLSVGNAEIEVRRYTTTPTQPLSYLVGKREMMAMRDWWFEKRGNSDLKTFHDEVLRPGSLPFAIIRRCLACPEL
jgi:uncharacterized protein (DUF885 family)